MWKMKTFIALRCFCGSVDNVGMNGIAPVLFGKRVDPFSSTHVRFCTSSDSSQMRQRRSPLYISRSDDHNVAIVDVDLDLTKRLEDLKVLSENLERRRLSLNVHLLVGGFSQIYTKGKNKMFF